MNTELTETCKKVILNRVIALAIVVAPKYDKTVSLFPSQETFFQSTTIYTTA